LSKTCGIAHLLSKYSTHLMGLEIDLRQQTLKARLATLLLYGQNNSR
jgi:hypothetical protein